MKRVPKKITVRMLERWGACPDGITDFRSVFGESPVAFTPGNVYRYEAEEWAIGLRFILTEIDPLAEAAAYRAWLTANDASPARVYYAAALCRLARQNLPAKKARQS